MIIVTGGAGFIGSNLVKALNNRGRRDILVVDDLSDGRKFINLADCDIGDYLDRDDFLERILMDESFGTLQAVFHQGACSTTTEWDGRYMMENNYGYSKALLQYCTERGVPFLYASSAAVYGGSSVFKEARSYEKPLNVYGYSKFLFDHYVRTRLPEFKSQVAGLRYFNVYGPREQHKGNMASVAYHFNRQLHAGERLRLFEGSGGYADGEQRRDFVYVGDIVSLNLWLLDNTGVSGIFNAGTGRSQTFNEVAQTVIDYYGKGQIEYIAFPKGLKAAYQNFTEADITALRNAGYSAPFKTVQQGVAEYLDILNG